MDSMELGVRHLMKVRLRDGWQITTNEADRGKLPPPCIPHQVLQPIGQSNPADSGP